MRRFLFGVVIATVTAALPSWAFGGDREIAEGIMSQLQQAKSQGRLKGFDLDLKVESGVVYLTGNVRSNAQRELVLDAVDRTTGVADLVDQLKVTGEGRDSRNFSLGQAVKQSTVVPASADESVGSSAADVSITDTIISKLQAQKQAGALKGFDLDVTTTNGDVALRGRVNTSEQKALVLDIARRVRGVRKVIDDVAVGSAVRLASTSESSLQPVPQSSMPVVGGGVPRPMAPAMMVNHGDFAGSPTGAPVPMQAGGVPYGQGAPRYDQAYMPSYAWPSYAAYPI
ncbi:MAG: BON domain-containing protein [Pirellulaceae bacterium]|nr:BON domain-containing protein [Pirellulaceae bacterium]